MDQFIGHLSSPLRHVRARMPPDGDDQRLLRSRTEAVGRPRGQIRWAGDSAPSAVRSSRVECLSGGSTPTPGSRTRRAHPCDRHDRRTWRARIDHQTHHACRADRPCLALDGVPALGISVYAALDDIGAACLDGILSGKLSTYRVVHLITVGQLHQAGVRPATHLRAPAHDAAPTTGDQVEPLLDLLGPARPNPHYGEMTGRRRR
jgi:hypothetical protein